MLIQQNPLKCCTKKFAGKRQRKKNRQKNAQKYRESEHALNILTMADYMTRG